MTRLSFILIFDVVFRTSIINLTEKIGGYLKENKYNDLYFLFSKRTIQIILIICTGELFCI